ncbi:Graves disease carrier protein homolog [Eumeta japonica]|uniref:Graves disease carrier protein homolog n=1 Tax=Eumeta variegata TaxID=151549 RepID=A0A4C1UTZ4_EUMVA|nr:Graves disease carrier protein homolog [Eumeta japonica]
MRKVKEMLSLRSMCGVSRKDKCKNIEVKERCGLKEDVVNRVETGVYVAMEGGVRALYRGFVPTLTGMVPYAGFSFYCFESLKYFCMKYLPHTLCKRCERNTGGLVLTVPGKLLCGGLAGAVAQSVSYPLDVTRRRMQLACMTPETEKFGTGMFRTLALIYRENGIVKGLYRGMSINYIRAIPMVAMSFSTYELMKQLLQLDTGMKV